MGRSFNRIWRVTIARPMSGRFFQNQTAVTVITEHDISFDVDKNLGAEPNTCELCIYNLAPATRAELEQKPVHVTLEAGYDGQLEQLFAGDVRWSRNKLDRYGWESKVQLGDGERAYRHARVTQSLEAGATVKQAVRTVANTMELTLDAETQAALAGVRHVHGLTLSGPSHRELTRLLAPHGLSWSIQDGRLQILSAAQTKGGTALLISQDTGMVGSPEWGAPTNDGKPPRLHVRTLLKPSLYPGRLIEVQSRAVNGAFKPLKVKSTGDSRSEDWNTSIEAVAA